MLDPRTHHPTDSFHLYDGTRHRPHTTWEPTNSLMWPSKPPLQELNQDDSGICSPPMWTTSPPHSKTDHRSLSPTSRTQAIVRGQRELMEMVKNMPESTYELSLKDLVEHHRLETAVEDRRNLTVYNRDKSTGRVGVGKRVDNKMTQVKRNRNIDRGGFYLKMGLPFSLGSKDKSKSNKKKSESSGNSSSRVTPKPDGSTKGGVDKECVQDVTPNANLIKDGIGVRQPGIECVKRVVGFAGFSLADAKAKHRSSKIRQLVMEHSAL
ncbi:uncharacterized protein HKW66_Vig0103740 [Vigna angularis]|uniref:Uncharacterized protein n=1 Tax=Phaseolus angularis TaxID=3914 RepID=A0A8T0KN27_PHAAN|nr:uncharacterized protein HKW66_Vig0103740 [Vigna angularis]